MNIFTIVMLGIGTILSLVYICLLLKATPIFSSYISNLSDKEHFFKVVYPVGFYILHITHYKYNSKLDRKRKKQCEIIHGKKYGEYYFVLNYAQKLSVATLLLPIPFFAIAVFHNIAAVVFGIVCIACAVWYYDMQITDIMTKRKDDVERELSNIISKITLLVNAGMILREAWEKISYTGESTLYLEMQNTNKDIENGINEEDALMAFSDRCSNMAVKKFISTLAQNVTKGNRELVDFLKRQTEISWEQKKNYVKQQGEKASSKLMIPIGIMFIGVLILIVVPIFANYSF